MNQRVKIKLNIPKKEVTREGKSNWASFVNDKLVPVIKKDMSKIFFANKASGFSPWTRFKEKDAGIFIRNTMDYLEKSNSIDRAFSYVEYIIGPSEDRVVLKVDLKDDTEEGVEGESTEYIIKSVLAFDAQRAEQIFDRVVSKNLAR